MKLTTQSRYGVRAVFDIAYHAGELPAQIQDISKRQRVSPRYLEQIFKKLKQVGILGSKRGPKGGYFLLRDPKDITVYDITASTDGRIELVFCVSEGEKGETCQGADCELKSKCSISPFWKEMGEEVADILRSTTIVDLCLKAEKLGIERHSTA